MSEIKIETFNSSGECEQIIKCETIYPPQERILIQYELEESFEQLRKIDYTIQITKLITDEHTGKRRKLFNKVLIKNRCNETI